MSPPVSVNLTSHVVSKYAPTFGAGAGRFATPGSEAIRRPKPATESAGQAAVRLDNENDTVRTYRERVRQCEALGEAMLH